MSTTQTAELPLTALTEAHVQHAPMDGVRGHSQIYSSPSGQRFLVRGSVPKAPAPIESDPPARDPGTTAGEHGEPDSVVVPFPTAWTPTSTFDLRQLWEGTVTSVDGDEFTAILTDLTNRSRPDEEATFAFDEIAHPEEFDLVKPGAVFHWSIGYEITVGGTRRTQSLIRFRRMPWTRRDLEAARSEADDLARRLGFDG